MKVGPWPKQAFGPPLKRVACIFIYESSTLAEAYGIKMWCYWENFEEHIKNVTNPLGI
jgi:hypothetical protein